MNQKETLPEIVLAHGRKQAEKQAIISGDHITTWGELSKMTLNCTSFISEFGLPAGTCIAVSAVMKAEFVAAYLAVKKLRLIAVPISKTASLQEAQEIIKRTETPVFLTDNPRYKALEQCVSLTKSCQQEKNCVNPLPEQEEMQDIPDNEPTDILFTSGSTGKPKGVVLSQKGVAESILNTAEGMDMRREDILLLPLPLHHSFGIRVLRSALYRGETIVFQNGFSFAKDIVSAIEQKHCNCMAAVNSGFEMLQQQIGEGYYRYFQNLRYIEFSAGAVPVKTREKLTKELPDVRLYNTWGSTETGGALFLEFSANKDKKESAGKGIRDIRVSIVDSEGEPQPAGQWGRLAIQSKALMSGYYQDQEKTEAALKNGWLLTNDLARMDEDGYVFLNGRIDDLINVGGEKVAPLEIEKIMQEQDGVQECACIGVTDPKGVLGQVPVAFIVRKGTGPDEKQMAAAIRKQGRSAMVPAEILYLDRMPRNDVGKLDKAALRKNWEEHLKGGTPGNNDQFADKVLELMKTRRSIRAFTDQPVSREILDLLVQAGKSAPSGHNLQTWRFTVLMNQKDIQELKKTTEEVSAEKKTLFYGFLNPDKMIIVSNDRRNPLSLQDSSCALENMLLMAHALRLGACWLTSWISISDEPRIRDLLNRWGIPPTHTVHGIMSLGYPAQNPSRPAKKDNVVYYID